MKRELDVVLYGATGFTGKQTVEYFARNAPPTLRWAIAGRNRQKLDALKAGVPVLVTDSADPSQCEQLTARTKVLLTTAGPFALYGDRLVAACVETGTHYVDITGEVAWVRSLIDRFHDQAAAQGTRIVPFCGFDSTPADLGVYLLVKQLGNQLSEVKSYVQAKGGSPNGGTIASALETYSSGAAEQGKDLFLLSPGFTRLAKRLERDPTGVTYDKDLQAWLAPFPMSIIDTRVVRRSCSLMGVDIAYQEFLGFSGGLAPVKATGVLLGTALFFAAMRARFSRHLVTKLFRAGQGPSVETMDGGWFRTRMRGLCRDGRTAEVFIAGQGDPANRITVKCVCESALAIASDARDLPARGGVLTPSTGIGDALVLRLQARGITFSLS
jgi:short subunit dehydrogenase-like uncharacterized protein